MRRLTTLLVAALLAAACTDDPATETGQAPTVSTAVTTTAPPAAAAPTSTTEPPTSRPPETTTTIAADSNDGAPAEDDDDDRVDDTAVDAEGAGPDDEDGGMCGDWTPVVTDSGTTCVDPETLPPEPVALGTPWVLPTVDAELAGERWWFEPLAVLNHDAVTLVEQVAAFDAPRITPWARLDAAADVIRVSVDGAIAAQQLDPDTESLYEPNEVVVYRPDGSRTVVPQARRLFDLAELDGRSLIVVADAPGDDEYDAELDLELRQMDDPAAPGTSLGWATAPEYGVGTVDIDGGLAVVSAWADLTELVDFRDLAGSPIDDLPSPTDGLTYNAAPYIVAATLSPDATHVTWAEGPDWDGLSGQIEPDLWRVKRMRLDDGVVVLDWPVTDDVVDLNQLQVASIHDLGDQIVVNLVQWQLEQWWPIQATVIDLAYEEPESYRLPITGLAVPVPYVLG